MRLVERVVSLGIPFLAGLASFAWGAASAMGVSLRIPILLSLPLGLMMYHAARSDY
jgi:hypothetical protein